MPAASHRRLTKVFDALGNPVVIADRALRGAASHNPPLFAADRPSTQLDPAVDTAYVTNVSGPVCFRTDEVLVFRWDTRHPSAICESGFAPLASSVASLRLFSHNLPSAFVPTSRDPNYNHLGPSSPRISVYRYLIDAPGGIDIMATLGEPRDDPEVVFTGGIRRENIVGAQMVMASGEAASFWANPHYEWHAANRHLPVGSEPEPPTREQATTKTPPQIDTFSSTAPVAIAPPSTVESGPSRRRGRGRAHRFR